MNIRGTALIFAACVFYTSCGEKPGSVADKDQKLSQERDSADAQKREEEEESKPHEDQIAEHCVAFLRATRTVPAQSPSADCPGCSAEGTEVLTFQQMTTDRIACSAETCEVVVTIRAVFKPGTGLTINGGLTAWIPPDQREAYLSGHAPAGEQAFKVRIIYRRSAERWRAIEFDRAES
ncbi:MAG TPA: hypothetical protein VM940_00035 [Chthoniobacterales bacterium]|nr:hypothetical protein [Chthoniobacterales bacterium]